MGSHRRHVGGDQNPDKAYHRIAFMVTGVGEKVEWALRGMDGGRRLLGVNASALTVLRLEVFMYRLRLMRTAKSTSEPRPLRYLR